MSTTPEVRYWQHVESGHVNMARLGGGPDGVAERDPIWREVTVAPVDGLRPDSGVIERVKAVLYEKGAYCGVCDFGPAPCSECDRRDPLGPSGATRRRTRTPSRMDERSKRGHRIRRPHRPLARHPARRH